LITASDPRNGTKGAGIGTTLCNLQVSDEGRGGENSRCRFIVEKSGFGEEALSLRFLLQELRNVLEVSGANKEVHLWQFLFQDFAISLREASRNDEKAATTFSLKMGELENGLDGLLRRLLDKRAGVDDEHFSL
jgi:hypothetical protein